MAELKDFTVFDIDWDMTPEAAVTLYLEWGNNSWLGDRKPVRHAGDSTTYFVVDTWGAQPRLALVRRSHDRAEELLELPLPEHLRPDFMAEVGLNRGVYAPTDAVKDWLRGQLAA